MIYMRKNVLTSLWSSDSFAKVEDGAIIYNNCLEVNCGQIKQTPTFHPLKIKPEVSMPRMLKGKRNIMLIPLYNRK